MRIVRRGIYRFFRGLFRGIKSCNLNESRADLRWNNYITFMDTMMQTEVIQEDTRLLFIPTGCDKIVINYKKHQEIVENLREDETIPAYFYKHFNIVKYVIAEIVLGWLFITLLTELEVLKCMA